LNSKIKSKKLILSGDSWLADRTWYQEIFDCEQVTNLAVSGAGNKYIAESVMSHIVENPGVDYVFVIWSGLNRVDIPLPLGVRTSYTDPDAKDRTTSASRYWTNIMAPWRDKDSHIHIEEKLIRLMYQEKGYTSVKNQSLINMINLQDFLKVRQIPYLFCFLYDYTNPDFDHNHLTGETETNAFCTLGSTHKENPILRELDRKFCMEPAGMDWALGQDKDHFKDPIHLTDDGYRAWARELLKQYNI
jgi:hypothetical protein